ncbi:hypothetical protein OPIT5_01270 [Opitutaceae bacterium TAV5]|nr:hypothetical protein OPIT5_01270 [Opitutaceae bacterium TAV5]
MPSVPLFGFRFAKLPYSQKAELDPGTKFHLTYNIPFMNILQMTKSSIAVPLLPPKKPNPEFHSITLFGKMKTKKHTILSLIIAITTIALFGCAAGMVNTTRNIPTALVARQYNDVYSQYSTRPTFASIETMKDGSRVLNITINAYGRQDHSARFYAQNASQYIAAIDKFIAWERQASDRGDMIEKEIAIISSPNGFKLSFDFCSGTPKDHFLYINGASTGMLGTMKATIMIFDKANAVILRKMIADLPYASSSNPANDYR